MTTEPLSVLLAEDDSGHAALIQRNLRRIGIVNNIHRVRDGQEALDFVHGRDAFAGRPKNSPLLIILDINMPRVDGVEVLRQLKADPATERIPVIMLTTTDDPREIERCYGLGCSVYVTKPVEYESFIDAVQRLGLFLEIVQVPREDEAREGEKPGGQKPGCLEKPGFCDAGGLTP